MNRRTSSSENPQKSPFSWFRYTPRTLLFMAGLVWFALGLFLFIKGISLLLPATQHREGVGSLLSLLGHYLPSPQESLTVLLTLVFLLGFCKGKYLLGKVAAKHIRYLFSLPAQSPLSRLYTKKNYFFLLLMSLGGMALRLSPLAQDSRGALSALVGFALMQGAMPYFRATIHYRYLLPRPCREAVPIDPDSKKGAPS